MLEDLLAIVKVEERFLRDSSNREATTASIENKEDTIVLYSIAKGMMEILEKEHNKEEFLGYVSTLFSNLTKITNGKTKKELEAAIIEINEALGLTEFGNYDFIYDVLDIPAPEIPEEFVNALTNNPTYKYVLRVRLPERLKERLYIPDTRTLRPFVPKNLRALIKYTKRKILDYQENPLYKNSVKGLLYYLTERIISEYMGKANFKKFIENRIENLKNYGIEIRRRKRTYIAKAPEISLGDLALSEYKLEVHLNGL